MDAYAVVTAITFLYFMQCTLSTTASVPNYFEVKLN